MIYLKNRSNSIIFLLALLILFASGNLAPVIAQEKAESKDFAEVEYLRKPSVTEKSLFIGGKSIKYTATVGYMTQVNENDDPKAYFFYTAYVADSENAQDRPLTFCFNGGPGSSSIYLHMLTIGPKRAVLADDGKTLAPPPRMVDNPYTWLDFTDLVFIDPVGTGFSRSATGTENTEFWGVHEDAASVAEFMRMYITANKRWLSPIFVAGESYGGVRGALLAEHLQNTNTINLNINGLIFISPAYDLQFVFTRDYDTLSLALYLPTYATTAWYHDKLGGNFRGNFEALIREVTDWSTTTYLTSLIKGDSLSEDEMRLVAQQMANYTGLSLDYVMEHKLRVTSAEFREELLHDQQISLDRLDARFESGSYELTTTLSPLLNHYLRVDLGYDTIKPYAVSAGGLFGKWNWGGMPFAFTVVPNLSQAMKNNPGMKVFVSAGYYDFAVPFVVIDHALDQLGLKPELQKNITRKYYQAGHMVYTPKLEIVRFTEDVKRFVEDSIK